MGQPTPPPRSEGGMFASAAIPEGRGAIWTDGELNRVCLLGLILSTFSPWWGHDHGNLDCQPRGPFNLGAPNAPDWDPNKGSV